MGRWLRQEGLGNVEAGKGHVGGRPRIPFASMPSNWSWRIGRFWGEPGYSLPILRLTGENGEKSPGVAANG